LRMIKAVFFDWLNTLVHPEPERHEIYLRTYRKFGVELDAEKLMKDILLAEAVLAEGNPFRWGESETETEEPHLRYQEMLLAESGLKLEREQILDVIRYLNQWGEQVSLVLYSDVLPALSRLKERGFILGMLTNMQKRRAVVYRELGLEPYLDVVVTSEEAGATKPKPPIFRLALERAGVTAQETVYIGDQYGTDVVGARRVDITPILIDRYDLEPEAGCLCIRSLAELDSCL
jgi:putative hydrolase of the HAD superfamily